MTKTILFNETDKVLHILTKDPYNTFQKHRNKITKRRPQSALEKNRQNINPHNAVDAFYNNRHNSAAVYIIKGLWGKQMLILC